MSKNNSTYALGIVAHPDDESFLLAGTALKLAQEGKSMGIICATKGEMGADRLNRKLSQAQMARIRVAEGKKAAKILKLKFLEFLNYKDGGLEKSNFAKLTKQLAQKINQHKPEVIFTFGREGISGHKDHIVIGKATIAAAKQAKHKPQDLLLASMPASCIKSFNAHLQIRRVHLSHFKPQILKGVADKKLLKIDIRKFAALKHQALKAHQSQYLPSFVLDIFQQCECYEVIKPS